ncbi:hypothetical protein HAX54_013273 [Datura stramonium]|uniref:Uncharacterized protein n=1 Tax=Datura stramonium TaxID=4076 RepID=A0ABS8TMW6_DATST|nr:hypothetical protein [Datura stramonium]
MGLGAREVLEQGNLANSLVLWNNEDEEHHAQISNMEKLILEHMEVMREYLTEQGGALKRMCTKVTDYD